jgi:Domain of unknown function (DUF4326)
MRDLDILDRCGKAPHRSISPLITTTRVVRSKKKGAKASPNTIYVGRPTLWGNPFTIERFGHAKCVILHAAWLDGKIGDLMLENMGFCPKEIETLGRKRARILENLHILSGKNLSCWCPKSSAWCHADTYIKILAERVTQ